jgi:CHC2 zinc finger/Toprim domain
MIADSDIAQARVRFDVIAADVALKRAGRELIGLCPWHNEKSPSFTISPEKGFFHCLDGETIVPTRDKGRQPIGALAGELHQLLMPDGSFQWAPVDSFGRQRLWAVELHRNGVERTLYTTSGHRWFKHRSHGAVLTEGLREGDRLNATKLAKRYSWMLDGRAVKHGIVFGNGSFDRQIYGHVHLHGEKQALAAWFLPIVPQAKLREGDKPYLRIYGGRQFEGFNTLPVIDDAPDSYLLGFLAGWLATDGCVDDRGAVILSSAVRGALIWARDAALRCGLETGAIGEQFRKGYLPEPGPLYRLEFRRSTLAPAMLLREPHHSRFIAGEIAFERKRWVVARAYQTSRTAEVFCAQVPGYGAFGLDDDLLTGNCFGCGAHGSVIDFVMRTRGLDFPQAVEAILGSTPRAPQTRSQKVTRAPAERPDDVAAARAIWAAASAEHRPHVELYFRSRYLRRAVPPTIRQHPGLFCTERRREIPALVAAFKDSAGIVSAVQRIWLEDRYDPTNTKGSRVDGAAKKTRGEMRDGCVRLGPAGPYMGIAEGVETALCAMEIYRIPVWATCGVARLPTVWIPDGVQGLTIFADRGAAGEEWAEKAAAAHGRRRPTRIKFPRDDHGDFADELRALALSRRGEHY